MKAEIKKSSMKTQNLTEKKLRSQLKKQGYALKKSKNKNIHANDLGGYMIIDIATNSAVAGNRYDLDLEAVEDFLKE